MTARNPIYANTIGIKCLLEKEVKSSNWSPKTALLELIDNAVDANAKNIVIAHTGRTLIVTDDGDGNNEPYIMLEFGNRKNTHGGKGTGQYGVGGSIAIAYMTQIGKATATSVVSGVKYAASADWENMDWNDPTHPTKIHNEQTVDEPNGTSISMSPVNGRKMSAQVVDACVKNLGILYRPGFSNGLTVTVLGRKVTAPTTPELESPARTKSITLPCGMEFKATMGVLKQGVNASHNRVYYGPRLMESGPNLISKSLTNTSRIIFDVYLCPEQCRANGLRVSTTKESFVRADESVDEIISEMETAILETFATELASAKSQIQQFRLDFMSNMLGEAVSGALSHKAANREYQRTGERTATTTPKRERGTEQADVDANEIGPEPAIQGNLSMEIRLENTTGDAPCLDVELIGPGLIVRLNSDKRFGRSIREDAVWIMGQLPLEINKASVNDQGSSSREAWRNNLVSQNEVWRHLLLPKKQGGSGLNTPDQLKELFNNASRGFLEQIESTQQTILNSME